MNEVWRVSNTKAQMSCLLIDREDCSIASTALLVDEPVVTVDVDHVSRIDDLKVKTY